MRSVWSERAKKSLHVVEDYILREFGENKRAEFILMFGTQEENQRQ